MVDPFAAAVHSIIGLSSASSTSSILGSCSHLPARLVVFTACNSWQFDMLLLQREGLKASTNCLSQRFVTVCLDDECNRECTGHRVDGCVRFIPRGLENASLAADGSGHANLTTFASVKPSPFGSADYYYSTFLTWEIIERAMRHGAAVVLAVDVDVLMLRDPFLHPQVRDLHAKHDLLFQTESGQGCAARVNSGFMILKRTLLSNVVEAMLAKKHEILFGKRLEQEILERVLGSSSSVVSRCALPGTVFTGHCLHPNPSGVFLKDVVTFHANRNDNQHHKVAMMIHFLNRVRLATTSAKSVNMTFRDGELVTVSLYITLYQPDQPSHYVVLLLT